MDEIKEVSTKAEPKKAPKKISVIVISTIGEATLIERQVGKKRIRVTVPAHRVENGKVTQVVFDAGMPFGVDWSEYDVAQISGDALYDELTNNGIWTYEDAQNNPVEVQFAIIRLANLIRVDLIEFARNKKT